MFVMNHAGEIGVGATTFVLGAAFSRSKGSLGVRLKRYQDNIASKICQFGKSVIRRRMHKLEALGEGLILRLKKGAMQVSGEFDEPMKGTDLNFVKRFLSDKRTNTRFWLYRPKADAGLGDFVIIDMSDAGPGRAIALELKEKVHGFAGKQVTGDGHDLLRKAGFGQIDLVTATESQFYEYIEYITKPLGAGLTHPVGSNVTESTLMGIDFCALIKCPQISGMDDPRVVQLENDRPREVSEVGDMWRFSAQCLRVLCKRPCLDTLRRDCGRPLAASERTGPVSVSVDAGAVHFSLRNWFSHGLPPVEILEVCRAK